MEIDFSAITGESVKKTEEEESPAIDFSAITGSSPSIDFSAITGKSKQSEKVDWSKAIDSGGAFAAASILRGLNRAGAGMGGAYGTFAEALNRQFRGREAWISSLEKDAEKLRSEQDPGFDRTREEIDQLIEREGYLAGASQVAKNIAKDPVGALDTTIGQGLHMLPAAAAGIAGGLAGTPAKALGLAGGAATKLGKSVFGAQTGAYSTILGSLSPTYLEGLRKFNGDEDKAWEYVKTKVGVDALINATGGAFLGVNPFAGLTRNAILQAGIQGTAGAAGAGLSSLSVGEKPSPTEMAMEFAGEALAAVPELAISRLGTKTESSLITEDQITNARQIIDNLIKEKQIRDLDTLETTGDVDVSQFRPMYSNLTASQLSTPEVVRSGRTPTLTDEVPNVEAFDPLQRPPPPAVVRTRGVPTLTDVVEEQEIPTLTDIIKEPEAKGSPGVPTTIDPHTYDNWETTAGYLTTENSVPQADNQQSWIDRVKHRFSGISTLGDLTEAENSALETLMSAAYTVLTQNGKYQILKPENAAELFFPIIRAIRDGKYSEPELMALLTTGYASNPNPKGPVGSYSPNDNVIGITIPRVAESIKYDPNYRWDPILHEVGHSVDNFASKFVVKAMLDAESKLKGDKGILASKLEKLNKENKSQIFNLSNTKGWEVVYDDIWVKLKSIFNIDKFARGTPEANLWLSENFQRGQKLLFKTIFQGYDEKKRNSFYNAIINGLNYALNETFITARDRAQEWAIDRVNKQQEVGPDARTAYTEITMKEELFAVLNALHKYMPEELKLFSPLAYEFFEDLHSVKFPFTYSSYKDFFSKHSPEINLYGQDSATIDAAIRKFSRGLLFTEGTRERVSDNPRGDPAKSGGSPIGSGVKYLSERAKEVQDIVRNLIRTSDSLQEFKNKIGYSILDKDEIGDVLARAQELWESKDNWKDLPTASTTGDTRYTFDLRKLREVVTGTLQNISRYARVAYPSDIMRMAEFRGQTGDYIRWLISRVEMYGSMRQKMFSTFVGMNESYTNLLKKDRGSAKRVVQAMLESDKISEQLKQAGLQWPPDSWLQALGLTKEEIKVYNDQKFLMDELWRLLESAMIKMGRTPPARIPGYFHHAWMGSYRAQVPTLEGSYRLAATTRNGLERKINKLLRDTGTPPGAAKITYQVPNSTPSTLDIVAELATSIYANEGTNRKATKSLGKFYSHIIQGFVGSDIVEGMERKGVRGFIGEEGFNNLTDKEEVTLLSTPTTVIEDVVHFYMDTILAKDVLKPVNDAASYQGIFRQAPDLYKWTVAYILRNTGAGASARDLDAWFNTPLTIHKEIKIPFYGTYHTGLPPGLVNKTIRSLNRMFSTIILVPSLPFYVANQVQPVYGGLIELSVAHSKLGHLGGDLHGALARTAAAFPQVLKPGTVISLDPETEFAVRWLIDNHFLDILQSDKVDPRILAKGKDWYNTLMIVGQFLEEKGRIITFLNAYNYFRDIYGKKTVKTLSASKALMDLVMFNYTPGHASGLTSDYGTVSSVLRPFATVQAFMLGRALQALRGLRKGQFTHIATLLAVSFMFAGLNGMIGSSEYEDVVRELDLDLPLVPEMLAGSKAKYGVLGDIAMYGILSGSTGTNIGRSLGYPGFSEVGALPSIPMVVAFGMMLKQLGSNTFGYGWDVNQLYKDFHRILPAPIREIVNNMLQDIYGGVPTPADVTEGVYKRNEMEQFLGIFGIRSTNEETYRNLNRTIRRENKRTADLESKISHMVYQMERGVGISWFGTEGKREIFNLIAKAQRGKLKISRTAIETFVNTELKQYPENHLQARMLTAINNSKDPEKQLRLVEQYIKYRDDLEYNRINGK